MSITHNSHIVEGCLSRIIHTLLKDVYDVAQLVERLTSNRRVAKSWVDFRCDCVSLCLWERHIMRLWDQAVYNRGGPAWQKTATRTILCWSSSVSVICDRHRTLWFKYERSKRRISMLPLSKNSLHYKGRIYHMSLLDNRRGFGPRFESEDLFFKGTALFARVKTKFSAL